ncbi:hypothetical protein J9303_12035 [Bacillaceae bacterium Marseille-Q3522]|nr:hypothetical protein [Bacillaceae bacterium Marseille-Q3522]
MYKTLLIILAVFLFLSANAAAETNITRQIEIFDIPKGEVIHNVALHKDLQRDAAIFIEEITDIYRKFNPIPRSGFMIRIPFERAIAIKNRWMDDLVDEVMIIFPDQELPYLMVFDNENNPYFFTFKGDTVSFLVKLNFNR